MIGSEVVDDENDQQLRLGFDFDGVIADALAEQFYKANAEDISVFRNHEKELAGNPLAGGTM